MNNVINVAKKEFLDLLSNRLIAAILIVYVIIAMNDLYSHYEYLNKFPVAYSGLDYLSFLSVFLTSYGSLVALAIGFFMIQSEKRSHTMNTLIVKPVYRDTVINGKLLGATGFLLFVLTLTAVLYSAGLLAFFGERFATTASTYVMGMPAAMFISLVYVLIFFAIAMFLSIFVLKEMFALFMGILVWFFFLDIVPNVLFSGNLSLVLGGDLGESGKQIMDSIALLSPSSIRSEIFMGATDIYSSLSSNISEVGKLLLYVLIPMLFSYIAFVRRDIA
jgi:ABC-2 type transport system permease protein